LPLTFNIDEVLVLLRLGRSSSLFEISDL